MPSAAMTIYAEILSILLVLAATTWPRKSYATKKCFPAIAYEIADDRLIIEHHLI